MVRWRSGRRSEHVEDRRGGRGVAVGGGIGVLVLGLVVWALGGDPLPFFQVAGEARAPAGPAAPPAQDEAAQFVSAILASTEDAWAEVFAERGAPYDPPTLVLFEDVVRSGCGTAGASTGPFYCPLDGKVYLDLGFFRDLARLGGPGDFAAAYVVGHEVGHHVQNLVGTADDVRRRQRGAPPAEARALSVRLELQADCYAGLWAHRAERERDLLEEGDVEEGLDAAAAIGDDRLQRRAGQAASRETFTHGSSAQRQRWLLRGLREGTVEACDTFSADLGA